MKVYNVELMYRIEGIKRVPIEAKSYNDAVKKFKKEHGIEGKEMWFDGMVTGPTLDLNTEVDSIEVDIMD